MMMMFPSTMPTIVMPPTLIAVTAFIVVSVAIDWSRSVDRLRRSLVHDLRRRDIHGTGNAQIDSDVRVGESRARSKRGGNCHCEKEGGALHGVLLSCTVLACASQ